MKLNNPGIANQQPKPTKEIHESQTHHLSLGIQSACQIMIEVCNHRNETQSIWAPLPFSEGEPGSLGFDYTP